MCAGFFLTHNNSACIQLRVKAFSCICLLPAFLVGDNVFTCLSVCLSVCLFFHLLTKYLRTRCTYIMRPSYKGKNYLILVKIRFKVPDLPKQEYGTSFLPYLNTGLSYWLKIWFVDRICSALQGIMIFTILSMNGRV